MCESELCSGRDVIEVGMEERFGKMLGRMMEWVIQNEVGNVLGRRAKREATMSDSN